MSDEPSGAKPCSDVLTYGQGQPVLMIHGFPFDHTMWQGQIEELSTACQLILPDLRGFGAATLAERDADDGIGMEAYADDLVAVLNKLEIVEPVVLCGFSMGGYILWQFALRHPDRVKALVLCDTRAAADTEEASARRLKIAEEVFRTGVEPIVQTMMPKLLSPKTLANQPQIVELVASMIRQASPAAIAAAQRGMARRPEVLDKLATFAWPSQVIVGVDDEISPPVEMQAIADKLPQAQYSEITNAGHMSPLENPSAFNRAMLEFLASL